MCCVCVISLIKIKIRGNFYLLAGGYRSCSVWLLTESREISTCAGELGKPLRTGSRSLQSCKMACEGQNCLELINFYFDIGAF